jgi:hypothetical protein
MSKTAEAIKLMADGMSMSEAAVKAGIRYATVYAATTGADKRKDRLTDLRVQKLAMSKRAYAPKEIARRTGKSIQKVVYLIHKNKVIAK